MQTPTTIADVVEKLISERATHSWEFLHIPTYISFQIEVSPARMKVLCQYKIAVNEAYGTPRRLQTFVRAVRATTFSKYSGHMDIRYSFVIRDPPHAVVCEMYMDFSHELVMLDGVMYRIHGALAGWFKDMAADVVKAA